MATTKKEKKKVEVKQELTSLVKTPIVYVTPIVSFDIWYSMRQAKIPAIHKMSIIRADFDARGIKEEEPVEVFDNALKKYGININN